MSQKLTLAASEACVLWVQMAVACASLGRVSSKLPLAAKGTLPGQDPVYGTCASALLISWPRMNSRLSAERWHLLWKSELCGLPLDV